MKKLFSLITLASLTIFVAITDLPVMAAGCRNHKNKSTEIKCDKDDTDCQIKKTKKLYLKEVVKS